MTPQQLHLRPFPDGSSWPSLTLTGQLHRSDAQLSITYGLHDPTQIVWLPTPASVPKRQDNLWQSTCFELFLGVPGCSAYWEVNVSATGDWNLYRFTDYRQGMQAEERVTALPIQTACQGTEFQLKFDLPLADLVLPSQPLEVSVTAVLATPTGALSYWALDHCRSQADFHCRESFTLRLEPASSQA